MIKQQEAALTNARSESGRATRLATEKAGSVENAQKKVEQRDYLSRKHILEYDDVMNNQRSVVYGFRNEVLVTEDPHALVLDVIDDSIPVKIEEFIDPDGGTADYESILQWINGIFPLGLTMENAGFENRSIDENIDFLIDQSKAAYNVKSAHEDPNLVEGLERFVILHSVDQLWQEHLYEMDNLRESVGNYRYAQKDPLVEYKHAAYEMFVGLMDRIKSEVLENLFRTTTSRPEDFGAVVRGIQTSRPDILAEFAGGSARPTSNQPGVVTPGQEGPDGPQIQIPKTVRRDQPKVGRNDPCSCGSGKKYKQCCGKL